MSYDYDFEVDNVEDDNVFIITSTSKNGGSSYKVMIYTYYDPFSVYYCEGYAPEDKDEFESQLFDYLGANYSIYMLIKNERENV